MTLSYIFFLLLCFLPWELYPLDPQIFYVLFQILYIRFTPYTLRIIRLLILTRLLCSEKENAVLTDLKDTLLYLHTLLLPPQRGFSRSPS